jgi:hypothetical protein
MRGRPRHAPHVSRLARPTRRQAPREAENVSWAELFQFVAPIDTTKVTERQKYLLKDLRWIYAADLTFYRIGMHLYKTQKPDFMTVYFRGVDEMSHIYWDIDLPGKQLSDAEYQWLKTLIPNYYVFTDRMIGDFLKEAGPKTDVLLTSDHGFVGGGPGVMAHKADGILFAMGPNVNKGGNVSGATGARHHAHGARVLRAPDRAGHGWAAHRRYPDGAGDEACGERDAAHNIRDRAHRDRTGAGPLTRR